MDHRTYLKIDLNKLEHNYTVYAINFQAALSCSA